MTNLAARRSLSAAGKADRGIGVEHASIRWICLNFELPSIRQLMPTRRTSGCMTACDCALTARSILAEPERLEKPWSGPLALRIQFRIAPSPLGWADMERAFGPKSDKRPIEARAGSTTRRGLFSEISAQMDDRCTIPAIDRFRISRPRQS